MRATAFHFLLLAPLSGCTGDLPEYDPSATGTSDASTSTSTAPASTSSTTSPASGSTDPLSTGTGSTSSTTETSSTSSSTGPESTTSTDGCGIACWPLDNQDLIDVSGNGHDGVAVGVAVVQGVYDTPGWELTRSAGASVPHAPTLETDHAAALFLAGVGTVVTTPRVTVTATEGEVRCGSPGGAQATAPLKAGWAHVTCAAGGGVVRLVLHQGDRAVEAQVADDGTVGAGVVFGPWEGRVDDVRLVEGEVDSCSLAFPLC